MFHLTIAIARFFEILLFDIARSVAGLIVLAVAVLLSGVGVAAGLRRLGQKFRK